MDLPELCGWVIWLVTRPGVHALVITLFIGVLFYNADPLPTVLNELSQKTFPCVCACGGS
jgi:hypothetical protein